MIKRSPLTGFEPRTSTKAILLTFQGLLRSTDGLHDEVHVPRHSAQLARGHQQEPYL